MLIRERDVGEKGEEIKNTTEVSKQNHWDPLVDGVKWIERYAEPLEKFFERLPDFISTFIATFGVFTLGATLRGEWVIILITALKQISGQTQGDQKLNSEEIYKLFTSENLKMENFAIIFIASHCVSYTMYFTVGGYLHWYYYYRRRHLAHEWKIQPNKWLSPELERHEIIFGVVSLIITNSFSAFLGCYIYNENPSTVYYQFDEYGWLWFVLQFPVMFIYMDYTIYILHRLYHTPWFYRHFHKMHHKYKQPTAFSVTAIHPVELLHLQLTMSLPLFVIPVHWFPYYAIVLYNYYHGIIDHSGINFEAHWWQPWQPPPSFHDQHHEFFHCNFGFNMSLWDKWHGTTRKVDRVYTEETYHGEAPPIDSPEALKLMEKDPDIKEYVEKVKSNSNKE
ncbi:unnamed protein product, partial [Brenthis ino]